MTKPTTSTPSTEPSAKTPASSGKTNPLLSHSPEGLAQLRADLAAGKIKENDWNLGIQEALLKEDQKYGHWPKD